MNPLTEYDLHEQKRLELLKNTEQRHHHNLLLNHQPQQMRFVSQLKNNIRSIPKLRHLRIHVRFEVAEPNAKCVNS